MKVLIKKSFISSPQRKLDIDKLFSYFKSCVNQFPDPIKRSNRTYSIEDISLAAFSTFYMQSPSFLAQQKIMKQNQGKCNAQNIFGLKKIPSDTHIKEVLDSIETENLDPLFDNIIRDLHDSGDLEKFKFLDDQFLIAFDGTGFFSSNKIHCDKCSTKKHKDGSVTYFHSVITPVIVRPQHDKVISLSPEFISPQDGAAKQDCEINAMDRWLNKHAHKYSDMKITVLGDDLYSRQPNIVRVLKKEFNYIFTCKVKSHKYLYECLSLLDSTGSVKTISKTKYDGKKQRTYTYRFANDLPLRKEDFINTNWCELVITNENGKVTFKTALVTNHKITENNVSDLMQAMRCRWKIENENNNVLKTKGYYLEHNFGHGKKNLTSLLVTMNLLAFLFHTVLHIVDTPYQLLREKLGARKMFFDSLRTLMLFQVFDSWHHLLFFMMEKLEIQFHPN